MNPPPDLDGVFSEKDLRSVRLRGMDPAKILSEIESFRKGFSAFKLVRPCVRGDGIETLGPDESVRYGEICEREALQGRLSKFVPASGAASRMFKDLIAVAQQYKAIEFGHMEERAGRGDETARVFLTWAKHLPEFAFYEDLRSAMKNRGMDLDAAAGRRQFDAILDCLLSVRGLNYAHLPKGMIRFHRYPERARTAFEEHLFEAAAFILDRDKTGRIHFTVPSEPPVIEAAIRDHLDATRSRFLKAGIRLEIGFSYQKPSSDTIAVDLENRPFRDNSGELVFWPGGHGVLLENLNSLNADIVFIKNIDNVVPDRLREAVVIWKKTLGGYLIALQERIFGYLTRIEAREVDDALLEEMKEFAAVRLSRPLPRAGEACGRQGVLDSLFGIFNRPLRVCGMVPNRGEPGGGPFWVTGQSGEVSLQIVESSQVDLRSPGQKQVWEAATHFNPVDLVCGVRDYRGRPFDLRMFSDPSTGFISHKFKDGRELKALELPGLWNGGMGYWNTFFVEVPVETFNPVKTVTDLLRPEHLT